METKYCSNKHEHYEPTGDRNWFIHYFTAFADEHNILVAFGDDYTIDLDLLHVRFKNPNYELRSKKYCIRIIDVVDPVKIANNILDDVIANVIGNEDEMIARKSMPKKTYRDKLVKKIKMAGQELIDRADSFIAADMDLISDFDIHIHFPQDGPIEINNIIGTYCKNEKEFYDMCNKERKAL